MKVWFFMQSVHPLNPFNLFSWFPLHVSWTSFPQICMMEEVNKNHSTYTSG